MKIMKNLSFLLLLLVVSYSYAESDNKCKHLARFNCYNDILSHVGTVIKLTSCVCSAEEAAKKANDECTNLKQIVYKKKCAEAKDHYKGCVEREACQSGIDAKSSTKK